MAKEESLRAIFDSVIECVKASTLAVDLKDGVYKDLERSIPLMMRRYDNTRASVKSRYMKHTSGLMDRHKVAACVMISVLTGLELSDSTGIKGGEFIKERIAIITGLSLLRTWIANDNENFKNGKIIAFLDQNDGLALPPPICDDKSYGKNWVLELHYNQKEAVNCGGSLPVLSMSDKLFLIESYNRALAGGYGGALDMEISRARQRNP